MVNYTFTLESFQYFLLILVRVTSFVGTAPFFSMTSIPNRVKVGFSAMVSILLFFSLPDATEIDYSGVFGYATVVIKEAMTGLLIGFSCNICTSIIIFAGRMIDMDIGLAMAMEFDPTSGQQVSITGMYYNYFLMMLLIISDMHLFIFRSFVDCYEVIPINQTIFDYDHLYESMLTYMTDYMVIGFRIILPVFICIMLLNVVLGIMSKVAPQMNMFAVGIQMKIMVGFLVLLVIAELFPSVANFIFEEIKKMMVLFVQGMY